MSVKKIYYEISLTSCCDRLAAIAILKQYRPYLEMIPSLRRLYESIITLPLPIVRFRGDLTTPDIIEHDHAQQFLPTLASHHHSLERKLTNLLQLNVLDNLYITVNCVILPDLRIITDILRIVLFF